MKVSDYIPRERLHDVAFLVETPGGTALFAGLKSYRESLADGLRRAKAGDCAVEDTPEYQIGFIEGLKLAEAMAASARKELANG